jgi:hypothetical protein
MKNYESLLHTGTLRKEMVSCITIYRCFTVSRLPQVLIGDARS